MNYMWHTHMLTYPTTVTYWHTPNVAFPHVNCTIIIPFYIIYLTICHTPSLASYSVPIFPVLIFSPHDWKSEQGKLGLGTRAPHPTSGVGWGVVYCIHTTCIHTHTHNTYIHTKTDIQLSTYVPLLPGVVKLKGKPYAWLQWEGVQISQTLTPVVWMPDDNQFTITWHGLSPLSTLPLATR